MLDINLSTHKNYLLRDNLTETELVKLVQKVSTQFTSQRDKISEYVLDEELVSAYAYFYLPTNIPKFNFLLNQINTDQLDDLESCTFIDWGTGPGTYLLAYLSRFPNSKVIGVDSSELMRKQARKMLDAYFPQAQSSFVSDYKNISNEQDVYLHFGNSLNEMSVSDVMKVIKSLSPKHLSFIEPGTPDVFEKIIQVRKELAALDFDVLFPCNLVNGACPMALKRQAGLGEWCHQVLRMNHNQSIERFSQLVKLDRKTMPLVGHFYTQQNIEKTNRAIVVRYLRETKFSFDYQVCVRNGDFLELVTIEYLKKSLTKAESKEFKKLSVGVELTYEIQKEISPNHFKVIKKAHS